MSAASKPDSDDVRLMFEGRYIGAWDLRGEDRTLTIERVDGGVVEGEGGRKDKAPLLYFKGAKKPLVCNKTNMRTIAAICGGYRKSQWIGKRITIYATTCKGAKGGIVDCVRVRPTAPGSSAQDSAMPEVPVDEEMRARQKAEAEGST